MTIYQIMSNSVGATGAAMIHAEVKDKAMAERIVAKNPGTYIREKELSN